MKYINIDFPIFINLISLNICIIVRTNKKKKQLTSQYSLKIHFIVFKNIKEYNTVLQFWNNDILTVETKYMKIKVDNPQLISIHKYYLITYFTRRV